MKPANGEVRLPTTVRLVIEGALLRLPQCGRIRGYMLRHKVKPGITGWAQVNGHRGETETVDKMRARVEHDLQYIDNWDLSWDIEIIFRTAFSVWSDRRAY